MSQEKVSAGAPAGAEAPAEIPERWSAARKAEVVLRVLRGEAIVRPSGVTVLRLADNDATRRIFTRIRDSLAKAA